MSLIDSGLKGRTALVFGASSGLGLSSDKAAFISGQRIVIDGGQSVDD